MLLRNWLNRLQKLLRSTNQRRSLRRRERRWPIHSHIESLESRTVLDGQPIVSVADASANEDAGAIVFTVSVDWTPVAEGHSPRKV